MARILLDDDDDPVRRVLSQMMSRHGHTVIEASNGKEGLDVLQVSRADLVITDIVMPGTEGTEVLIALRKKNPVAGHRDLRRGPPGVGRLPECREAPRRLEGPGEALLRR